jgi:putative peptidoglycan lipid II flippase
MENNQAVLEIGVTKRLSTQKQDPQDNKPIALNSRQLIVNNARVVSFFTFLSRILGFVRDLIMLHIFGAGAVYDAFIIALTIPNVLRRLTAEGSLSMVFVPLYIEIKEKRSPDDAKVFAQKVASLVIIVCTFLVALGIGFSENIVSVFASGFEQGSDKFLLTVSLTKIMFPYLIFISLVALAMGILNSEQHFAAPAAAPILLNLSIIIATLFFTEYFAYPIQAAAWGVFLAGFAQLALQLPFLIGIKQPLMPKSFWKDDDIKRLLKLMGPTLFGVAVYQINIIILRNIASGLPDGHISYYNIASRLQELVIGVFAFAYATASLPEFSKYTGKEDWGNAFSTLRSTISSAMFIVLPATAGFMAFALPIVSLLFLHGEFTWRDTQISAFTLQVITISIPALTLVRILVAIFFAMKDTRSPVFASIVSVIVTASLGWYLAKDYQVAGLVFALSIGVWAQAFVLLFILRLKRSEAFACLPLLAISKYSLLSICIGILVYQCVPLANWQDGPSNLLNWALFLGVILTSVLSYVLVLSLAKDENAQDLVNNFKSRLPF